MFRILFLILLASVSIAFAQTEEKPKARLIDEFKQAPSGYVKMIMDTFYIELANDPSAQGYIINYGTDREVTVREGQIRNAIAFRKFDASRITMVRGGFFPTVKTELWIVPPGAESPLPTATANLIDEFGKANAGDIKVRMDNFMVQLGNNPKSQGYIFISGKNKEVTAREKMIRNYIKFRKFDLARVTFKKTVLSEGIKTEFWMVPPDPENPAQKK